MLTNGPHVFGRIKAMEIFEYRTEFIVRNRKYDAFDRQEGTGKNPDAVNVQKKREGTDEGFGIVS